MPLVVLIMKLPKADDPIHSVQRNKTACSHLQLGENFRKISCVEAGIDHAVKRTVRLADASTERNDRYACGATDNRLMNG